MVSFQTQLSVLFQKCKFCLNRHYNQRKTFTQLSHYEKMSVDISYCNKMKSDHLLNVKVFHQNKN